MNSKSCSLDGFVGDFKEPLIQFVQMKQSLGFDYFADGNRLRRFSKFSLGYPITNYSLTKELADAWTEKRPNEREVTRAHRINNLKQFAIYLNHLGYESYVPSSRTKVNYNLYVPYIFTHEELQRFFKACSTIKPYGYSNQHRIFPALYMLLYGCGLRISEAVVLQLKNVDLDQGIITILGSKFGKDRSIPLSESMTQYFRSYYDEVHVVSTPEDYFFMKNDKTTYSADTVYKVYRKLLWKSGISHGGKGRGPRMHDFRHTFAVHSLNQMVQHGVDLYCALPILSTYLGHASIGATEQYLRLAEEAYPGIIDTISQTCAYIFPEVKFK